MLKESPTILLYINLGNVDDGDLFPTECYAKASKFKLSIYRLGMTIIITQ